MFGGELSQNSAERVVDSVLRGFAAERASAQLGTAWERRVASDGSHQDPTGFQIDHADRGQTVNNRA